jgi:hypothetical protein
MGKENGPLVETKSDPMRWKQGDCYVDVAAAIIRLAPVSHV